ncbi:hypothetical protein GOV07_00860 [Candidatus Woesearchaeota archaeon]|nr:hypothetical protein [Candidatus Woesearchaeota archaeon]
MTTAANYTFASLALSAKLHKLLDKMGASDGVAQDSAFNAELEQALDTLEGQPSMRDEARHLELMLLKRDFEALEELYTSYKEKEKLPATATEKFEAAFTAIKDKIKEKELTI